MYTKATLYQAETFPQATFDEALGCVEAAEGSFPDPGAFDAESFAEIFGRGAALTESSTR